MDGDRTFTAFLGHCRMAAGDLRAVAAAAAAVGQQGALVILDDATGRPVELDVRGGADRAVEEYIARATQLDDTPPRRPGRGRPRLGVVAREVTLLPRHWEWLGRQPGGASAALRRLVEEARRAATADDRARETQETLYRVMSTLAGDAAGFEEASRALFAGDDARFDGIVAAWPADVAAYVGRLARVEREARNAG